MDLLTQMIFVHIVSAAGEEVLGEYSQLALGGKEVLTGGFKVKVKSGRQHYALYKLRLVSNTSSARKTGWTGSNDSLIISSNV